MQMTFWIPYYPGRDQDLVTSAWKRAQERSIGTINRSDHGRVWGDHLNTMKAMLFLILDMFQPLDHTKRTWTQAIRYKIFNSIYTSLYSSYSSYSSYMKDRTSEIISFKRILFINVIIKSFQRRLKRYIPSETSVLFFPISREMLHSEVAIPETIINKMNEWLIDDNTWCAMMKSFSPSYMNVWSHRRARCRGSFETRLYKDALMDETFSIIYQSMIDAVGLYGLIAMEQAFGSHPLITTKKKQMLDSIRSIQTWECVVESGDDVLFTHKFLPHPDHIIKLVRRSGSFADIVRYISISGQPFEFFNNTPPYQNVSYRLLPLPVETCIPSDHSLRIVEFHPVVNDSISWDESQERTRRRKRSIRKVISDHKRKSIDLARKRRNDSKTRCKFHVRQRNLKINDTY